MHNIKGVRIKEKPGFEKSVFLALTRMPSLIVGRLLSARQAKTLPKGARTVQRTDQRMDTPFCSHDQSYRSVVLIRGCQAAW